MPSLIQRLLGLGFAVIFTANSFLPGLLCACGGDQPVGAGMVMHGGTPMGHMTMPMPSGHRPSGPAHSGTCDCVGHACCMSVPVLPAQPTLPGVRVVLAEVGVATRAPGAPVTRPRYILPLAQAPPLSLV
jgi:hypothetical protein